jgi:hypothetical protein
MREVGVDYNVELAQWTNDFTVWHKRFTVQ